MSAISKLIAEQILAKDFVNAKKSIAEAVSALTIDRIVRQEFEILGEDYEELSEELQAIVESCKCGCMRIDEEESSECGCDDEDDEDDEEIEDESEESEEDDEDINEGVLTEGKRIIKRVNAKGKIIRKVKCSAGMKAKDGKCVRMPSSEKLTRKKALIKRKRTLKRKSASAKRKALVKRARAMRKRHSMGL